MFIPLPAHAQGTSTSRQGGGVPSKLKKPLFAPDALDARIHWLHERDRLLDRSSFDLGALLDALDYDPGRIVKFVAEDIAFEDYPGVLRGPLGTLTSRAGNDLDQALLLARLLKDAGLEARIALGKATAGQLGIPRLLLSARKPPKELFVTTPALEASDRDASELTKETPPGSIESFAEQLQIDSAKRAGDAIPQIAAHMLAALQNDKVFRWQTQTYDADQVRDYAWVEYRQTAAGGWTAVHPVLGSRPAPFDALTATTYLSDSVPESLQQRVRIQAFLERDWDGHAEVTELMPAWERPAANLGGVTVSYTNLANGFLDPGVTDGDAALAKSTLFFPALNNSPPKGALAFDLHGNTAPVSEASSQMAGTFERVGENFGKALDALSSDGKKGGVGSKRLAVRQWLEITLIRPGLPDKTIVRNVARWSGDANAFRRSLARTVLLRFQTGTAGGGASLDRIYTALAETLKSLRYFQNHPNPHTTPPEAEPPDPLVGFQLGTEAFLMVSDALSDELPGLRSYRTEPTVLARYLPFGRVDATRDGFDVMNDARRVIDRHDATFRPEGALRIGVTDTWLEHLLFAAPSGVGGSLFGQLDNDSAAPPLVVRDAADPRLKDCDPATRRVLREELSAGNVLLVPPSQAARGCQAWWQVESRSGSATGMIATGWGGVSLVAATQTMVEKLAELAAIHGAAKVGAVATGCTAMSGVLRAGVALKTLLRVNTMAGPAGVSICSFVPPHQQVLCQAVVAVCRRPRRRRPKCWLTRTSSL